MSIPYTYLIGWVNLNTYYYGCRFAKNCQPSDLFNPYPTSSKYVRKFIEENGLPDIIQIRKTFTDAKTCRRWETKVLKRMNMKNDSRFLNKTDNEVPSAESAGHRKGKTWEEIYGKERATQLKIKVSEQGRRTAKENFKSNHWNNLSDEDKAIKSRKTSERNKIMWKDPEYVKTITEAARNSLTREQRQEIGRKNGRIIGKQHAKSGHCQSIAHLGGAAHKDSVFIHNKLTKEVLRLHKDKADQIIFTNSDWQYGNITKVTKQVKVGETLYHSQVAAGKAHGITAASVRDRVLSKNFPDWNYFPL